jgi:hypothetical protein
MTRYAIVIGSRVVAEGSNREQVYAEAEEILREAGDLRSLRRARCVPVRRDRVVQVGAFGRRPQE